MSSRRSVGCCVSFSQGGRHRVSHQHQIEELSEWPFTFGMDLDHVIEPITSQGDPAVEPVGFGVVTQQYQHGTIGGDLGQTDAGVDIVHRLEPFYWMRLVGGTLYLIGAVYMGWNFYKTIRGPAPTVQATPATATT